eukprot:13791443-Alexandrium_andersonii.AAC.1
MKRGLLKRCGRALATNGFRETRCRSPSYSATGFEAWHACVYACIANQIGRVLRSVVCLKSANK